MMTTEVTTTADVMTTSDVTNLLNEIAQRVLWLSVRIVDAANRERETSDGVKVGGHQASSASLVTAMTALWFHHLTATDRVSVKPHASPVLHAINYLLGDLDRSYLTRLRAFGGLQSYPSRTKDPDRVDFSTGSVGLGPAAPLFAAAVRRYVDTHFGARDSSRFVALLGDAELDEGNIWEAIADHATAGLGNVLWIVDFNRQSLDRVVPGVRAMQWQSHFHAAGWQVLEVKYGHRMRAAFKQPGGTHLRDWIDAMPNEQYQSLFALDGSALRERFLEGAPQEVHAFTSPYTGEELKPLVTDLGGHDMAAMLDAYAQADATPDRPTVLFAYTVKGWGLPTAGNPRNHSALLTGEQIDTLRAQVGLTESDEWDRFDPATPAGILANRRREALALAPRQRTLDISVPSAGDLRLSKPISTQEVFGRVLVDLSRDARVAPYLVTTAPDVATSTNLAGFINRLGVFAPVERREWSDDPLLRWSEGPSGHHIELGISEMNLFLLLGQLGLSWDLSDQPLIPIGTVYDPFVLRGLDALIYGVYSGSRFIVAGTPSGVTLAAEGGAHQSTVTASVGLELPGLTMIEPAYGVALDWLLRDAVARTAGVNAGHDQLTAGPVDDGSYYFRLTTRPLDQAPFEAARARLGDTVLRRAVLSGGYRLIDAADHELPSDAPKVHVVATGAILPEAIAAAMELASEGIAASVVDVTSLDRLYRSWQRTLRQGVRTATAPSIPGALRSCFPDRAPIVTAHDAASHTMAWLGSALGVPAVSLGVDSFGQSGTVHDLYAAHDLDAGSIVNGALAALSF